MKRILIYLPLSLFLLGFIGMQINVSSDESSSERKIVDLSGQGLKEIPEKYKANILNAEILILDNNDIVELPQWFSGATAIRKISFNGNPNFDFFKFCLNFQSLTEINDISASNCNINLIPYNIIHFDKLSKLDLSQNKLTIVPFHFSFLSFLIDCDLSYNEIEEVGYSFRDLYRLKKLNLLGNEKINCHDVSNSLEGKNLEYLGFHLSDTLPESINSFTSNTLEFSIGSNLILDGRLGNFTCDNLLINNFSEAKEIPNNLIKEISSNKSLKTLSFANFIIRELPIEFKNLINLKSLDVSASKMTSIHHLEEMGNLQELLIQENELSLQQLNTLKTKLPNCKIESDEKRLKGDDLPITINPPVKSISIPQEISILKPQESNKIISKSGTTILEIPENAFLDEKGKVVTSPVEIKVTEYNNAVDIALSGIPMQIKNKDGSIGDFSSAGMFDFKATANGKEVFPNPNSLIKANIISKQKTPYDLYTFKNGEGWTLAQKNPIQPAADNGLFADVNNNVLPSSNFIDYTKYQELLNLKKLIADTITIVRQTIFEPKLNVKTKKQQSSKTFTINFDFLKMYYRHNYNGDRIHVEVPKDYDKMINSTLVYHDNNYEKDSELMDSIKREIKKIYFNKKDCKKRKRGFPKEFVYSENILLKNVNITPDLKKDDFILSFNYKGKMHEFHVILNEGSSKPATIQKQNEKYYQNFLYATRTYQEAKDKALKKYNDHCDRLEARAKAKAAKYQREFDYKSKIYEQEFKKNGLSFQDYFDRRTREEGMVFTFAMANFGMTNCDVVARMSNPQKMKVTFKDVLGKTILFIKMFRIDKRSNMISSLTDVSDGLIVDFSHDQTALMFIMEDLKIGIVDSKTLFDNRGEKEIRVKVLDAENVKSENVRFML